MTTADLFEKGITAWPGQRVYVPGTYRVAPGRVELPFVWAGESADFRLPNDLHLYELMDLDLRSDEAVLSFMGAWGIPNASQFDDPWFRGGWSDVIGRFCPDPRAKWSPRPNAFAALESAVSAQLARSSGSDDSWEQRDFIHIDEARVRFGLVRDMVRLWALTTGAITTQVFLDSLDSKWWLPQGPRSADKEVVLNWAWRDLMIPFLNHALSAFSVHLELDEGIEGIPEANWGAPYGNPYQTLCLLLMNDIAERQSYKVCANETCGRLFTRQRGRATAGGSHSTGVAYCSLKCNRSASQRVYRRNVRRARELAEKGLGVAAIAERMGVSAKSVRRYLKQD